MSASVCPLADATSGAISNAAFVASMETNAGGPAVANEYSVPALRS
jgi:hypothetical protein